MSFLYTLTVTLTEAAEKQAEKMVIERVSKCLNSLNGDFFFLEFMFFLRNKSKCLNNFPTASYLYKLITGKGVFIQTSEQIT